MVKDLERILKKYRAKSLQSLARKDTFLDDMRTLRGEFIGVTTIGDRLVAVATGEIVTLVLDEDWSLQFESTSYIFDGVNV